MHSGLRNRACRLPLALALSLLVPGTIRGTDPLPRVDASGPEERLVLSEHRGEVNGVAFTAGGKHILSAGSDGTIRRWDVTTGLELQVLTVPAGYKVMQIFSLAEDRRALSLSLPHKGNPSDPGYRSLIQLWNLETGQETHNHPGAIVGRIAVASDGRSFVGNSVAPSQTNAGTATLTIGQWDVETGTRLLEFPYKANEPADLAFLAGREAVLVSTPSTALDSPIGVWNLTNNTVTELARGPIPEKTTSYVSAGPLTLSPDERFLFSHRGALLSIKEKNVFQPVAWTTQNFRCLKISPDSRFAVLGGVGTIGLVDLNSTGKPSGSRSRKRLNVPQPSVPMRTLTPEPSPGHSSVTSDADFSPDGRLVAVAVGGFVSLWDLETAVEVARCGGLRDWVTADARCSSREIQSGFKDHALLLRNKSTQEMVRLQGHTAPVLCVIVSPDCRYAVSAGLDRTVRIWNLETGELVRVLSGHRTGIRRLALSENGEVLLSIGIDRVQYLWDMATGRELQKLEGSPHPYESVSSLSSDGRRILTLDVPGVVCAWDVQSGKLIRKYEIPAQKILGMKFSPDGDQVLLRSRGKPGYFLVDAATGKHLNPKGLSAPWVLPALETMALVPSYQMGGGGTRTIIIPR